MPRLGRGRAEPPLRTVDRCLQMLSLFSASAPEWSPARAAAALGIPRSVAQRLLATLAGRGFLAQDPETRRYRLGSRLIALGLLAQRSYGFAPVRPVLRRLADATGESVFVTVVEGDVGATVEKVERGDSAVRLTLDVGARSPLHAGASQRVLLAYLPPAEQEQYLAEPLPAFTPHTPTDPAVLREHLALVRARGYDYSVGELTPGVAALAVPLFAAGGILLGSLSLAGPAERFPPEAAERALPQLRAAAAAVERHFTPDPA
jgi:IclR family acetate operon transcriptional repressor